MLTDVPAPVSMSAEGDMTSVPMDVPNGLAWLVTDNLPDETPPTSATRVMWWRDDGRLWPIAGTMGYEVTAGNGQVNLIWPTGDADRWGMVYISAPLADRVDEIAAAIVPVVEP